MNPATENIVAGTAFKFAMVGSVTTTATGAAGEMGWLEFLGFHSGAISSLGVIAGILLGFGSFCVQWYFNNQRHKRESIESTWRMGIDPDRRKNPPGGG